MIDLSTSPKNSAPWSHLVPTQMAENLEFRTKLLRKAKRDAGFQKQILAACALDPIFFTNTFAWQFNPKKPPRDRITPFIARPFQVESMLWLRDAIEAEEDGDRLIEKSREMGVTWFVLILADWLARFQRGFTALVASRDDSLVDERDNPKALMWKLDFLHKNFPIWLQGEAGPRAQPGPYRIRNHIAYPEGNCSIDGESTNRNLARGDRRTLGFLDENPAMPNGDLINNATSDAFHIRLKVGTPEGPATSFARDKQRMNREGLSSHIKTLHWSVDPVKARGLYSVDDQGQVEYLDREFWTPQRMMDVPIVPTRPRGRRYNFRSPWYDSSCKTRGPLDIARNLDIDDEGSVSLFYDPAEINRLRLFCRTPDDFGQLEYDLETGKPIVWRSAATGTAKFNLWCKLRMGLPRRDTLYGIGADVGSGMGKTNSVLSVVDLLSGDKVAEVATPNMRPDKFAVLSAAVGWFFTGSDGDPAILVCETQGPGQTFLKVLISELGYRKLWRRNIKTNMRVEFNKEPGWGATKDSKRALHEAYRSALASGRFRNYHDIALDETLEYINLPDGSVDHVEATSRETDPSEAKANHGDRATADALANMLINFDRAAQSDEDGPESAAQYPQGSVGWQRRQRLLEQLAESY